MAVKSKSELRKAKIEREYQKAGLSAHDNVSLDEKIANQVIEQTRLAKWGLLNRARELMEDLTSDKARSIAVELLKVVNVKQLGVKMDLDDHFTTELSKKLNLTARDTKIIINILFNHKEIQRLESKLEKLSNE